MTMRISASDAAYPPGLLGLARPPQTLWVAGRPPDPAERLVAVVGSRAASGRGCALAGAVSRALVSEGVAVVSGGALGIDAAAHEAVCAAGGATFAVLGCGVDVVYPDRHADLFARIQRRGGLLSEHPNGTKPLSRHFPSRNRLIVALAEAVVVIEAALRSGALITARLAQKMNRRLLAVPGSVGTDGLLNDGAAIPVRAADDVRAVLAGERSQTAIDAMLPEPPTGVQASLLEALTQSADSALGVARRMGLPLPEVLAALTEAELSGRVRRGPGGQYEVNRGC